MEQTKRLTIKKIEIPFMEGEEGTKIVYKIDIALYDEKNQRVEVLEKFEETYETLVEKENEILKLIETEDIKGFKYVQNMKIGTNIPPIIQKLLNSNLKKVILINPLLHKDSFFIRMEGENAAWVNYDTSEFDKLTKEEFLSFWVENEKPGYEIIQNIK